MDDNNAAAAAATGSSMALELSDKNHDYSCLKKHDGGLACYHQSSFDAILPRCHCSGEGWSQKNARAGRCVHVYYTHRTAELNGLNYFCCDSILAGAI